MIYRRRRLEPLPQRVRRFVRRMRSGFDKRQRVYLVEIGDTCFKQIVVRDSARAAEITQNLEQVGSTGIFPRVFARHRNELWVEYIDGRSLDPSTAPPVDRIAEVFAGLYRIESKLVPLGEGGFLEQSLDDLRFIERSGILSAGTAGDIADRLRNGAPAAAWVGWDYGDARAQNFVVGDDGRLRVIDVESIRRHALVGTGVVRALERWPEMDRAELVRSLERRDVPPFWTYMRFLELAFACAWTKRRVLRGKLDLAQSGRLHRLAWERRTP